MSSKKGFQMGVNVLVVMILGIIIVAGGLVLVSQLLGNTDPLIKEISFQQREELQRMLTSGQLVAVTPQNQIVKEEGDGIYFLGVENRLDDDHAFKILPPVVLDSNGDPVGIDWIVISEAEMFLLRNEQDFRPIVIRPPEDVLAGTYDVIVTVTTDIGMQYDSPAYFTVKVG